MKRSRTLLFGGLTVVAFAFLGGNSTVGQDEFVMESPSGVRSSDRDAVKPSDAVADLGFEVARLRERLDRTPVSQNIVRNPFLFLSEDTMSDLSQNQNPSRVVPDPVREVVPRSSGAQATFSFIGVALQGDQRTAIFLLDNGRVVVAGIGGAVANGYQVGAIEEAAVSVMDSAGVIRRHELR